MDFDDAYDLVQTEGFPWARFQEIFPFGDAKLREGKYEELLSAILKSLGSDKERSLLLDLLDAQHCVFLEQIGHVQIMAADSELFEIEGHFISAQLQINSNLRNEFQLSSRDAGAMMYNLNFPSEHLIDRMMSRPTR